MRRHRTKFKATKVFDKNVKLVQVDKKTWVEVAHDIPDKQVREKYVLHQLQNLQQLVNPPKEITFFR